MARTLALAGVAGAVAGAGVVVIERAWLWPPALELGAIESLRVMLSGLIGGLITIAVFSLWMRTVVAGLVSDQFSPRMLVTFLDDDFQRRLLAALSAGLVAVAVLILGLPEAEDAPVPIASAGAAIVVSLAALGGVFTAIQHAIHSLSPLQILSRLAEQALDVLRAHPAPGDPVEPIDAAASTSPVRKESAGWVVRIDDDALLHALPPEGALILVTRVGEFVTPRTDVAYVAAGTRGEANVEAIRAAVEIAPTRDRQRDLAFALGHLVDVAAYAITGGGKDTATAYEALAYLGAVLERVVRQGLQPAHRVGAQGRRVLDRGAWGAADHVRACVERLRVAASREPDTARHLLQLLEKTRAAALESGDDDTISEIKEQTEAVLKLIDAEGIPARDRALLERVASRVLGRQ